MAIGDNNTLLGFVAAAVMMNTARSDLPVEKEGRFFSFTTVIVGTVLDAIAQFLIFQRIHLLPALLVGAFVMGVPYSLARGISNRVITAMRKDTSGPAEATQEQP
jgi:hypothetical protein